MCVCVCVCVCACVSSHLPQRLSYLGEPTGTLQKGACVDSACTADLTSVHGMSQGAATAHDVSSSEKSRKRPRTHVTHHGLTR